MMFLSYLILLTALCLSAVAAFYSIVGLTAIFASAVVPIIIMGGILEISKLVVTVWLHEFWDRCKFTMKLYLVPAVVVLMFITSMGIFGFLSKAHIQQTSASAESVAQVERIITEIARLEAVIDRAEQKIQDVQNTGTGADVNIQAQIDREQQRIDSAYKRVQPLIGEQQSIIAGVSALFQSELDKIDSDLARLQGFIDNNEIAKAQAMVGARADGQFGNRTATAFRDYQTRKAQERAQWVKQIQDSANSPAVVAAREEIARLRTQAEAQIAQSNQLINRLRSQLGTDTGVDIEAVIDEQTARIKESNIEIDSLTEERYALEAQFRQLEAEVGPVKYIAEMIYGQEADKNLLEQAVRWVIIVIVAVFDPLAIMMLLAATESFAWSRKQKDELIENSSESDTATTQAENASTVDEMVEEETEAKIVYPIPEPLDLKEIAKTEEPVDENIIREKPNAETNEKIEDPEKKSEPASQDPATVSQAEQVQELIDQAWQEAETDEDLNSNKIARRVWKTQHPEHTLKKQERLLEQGKINALPWQDLALQVDEIHAKGSVDFGTAFPSTAEKGDVYIRVDFLPTKLYKYNGKKWIEVDKNITDTFAYNENYIEHLIEKLASGEYDPELLNDSEREQIEIRLKTEKDSK